MCTRNGITARVTCLLLWYCISATCIMYMCQIQTVVLWFFMCAHGTGSIIIFWVFLRRPSEASLLFQLRWIGWEYRLVWNTSRVTTRRCASKGRHNQPHFYFRVVATSSCSRNLFHRQRRLEKESELMKQKQTASHCCNVQYRIIHITARLCHTQR